MKIYVLSPNTFTGDDLAPGEEYEVFPADTGTERQNRAWHSLLQEYWLSGCHSYNAVNILHFRELIKLYLGAGSEKYYSLIDDTGKRLEKPVIGYRVKSWAKYTKKERKESIDKLIAEMIQAGVNTKKFHEILNGLEENRMAG